MNDVPKNFPILTAGLKKASERFDAVKSDPEWQRGLDKLREYIRSERALLHRCGAIEIPGDGDFDLADWCRFADRDPSTVADIDELYAAIRAKLLGLKHREAFQNPNAVAKFQRPDGPFAPDGFCWKGQEFRGLSPLPWRLLNHLWGKDNRSAPFDELAEKVWRDHAVEIDGTNFGNARKPANKWLKENGLPFKVSSKNNMAVFEEL